VKNKLEKVLKNYKKNLEIPLENDNCEGSKPIFSAANRDYEISERISAISCVGIGLVDQLIRSMELPGMINSKLYLLKQHKPCFESDHILKLIRFLSPESLGWLLNFLYSHLCRFFFRLLGIRDLCHIL